MVGNIIGFLLIILLLLGFGWLAWRSWQSRRGFIKWAGGIFSTLFTLIIALLAVLAVLGLYKLYIPRSLPVPSLSVTGTAEQISRGEHIAVIACVQCHSKDDKLPLDGGKDVATTFPIPVGSLVSFNLTPGGPLKDWSDGEVLRALRTGVDRDGHKLIAMSFLSIRNFSDADLHDLIAYLRSQPPVTTQTSGGDHPNFLFTLIVGSGVIPEEPPVNAPVVAPPIGPTADYGKYIVSFQGCRGCHGPDLADGGGLGGGAPSLRVVKGWTLEQFTSTIQDGVDPSGHQLSDAMPWKNFSKMDDVEMAALYAYLHSLP